MTSSPDSAYAGPSSGQYQFPGHLPSDKLAETQPFALCSSHPPHPSWNDDSSPEHGYENPYYSRAITDFLWLPRDPLAILDLDDTVDLRVSITSEPGAGKLGTWSEEDFIGSTLSLPSALSVYLPDFEDASLDDPPPKASLRR